MDSVDNVKNKIMRIDALRSYYRTAIIWMYNNNPIRNQLFQEYLQYNRKESTADRHDDGLDALATLVQRISTYLVQNAYKDMRAFSGRALANQFNRPGEY